MSVVMSRGIMMAVPDACTTRPTTSTANPGAMSAMRVPVEKRPIASANIERVEKRLRRNPVVGITTAIVSMKAVVSH